MTRVDIRRVPNTVPYSVQYMAPDGRWRDLAGGEAESESGALALMESAKDEHGEFHLRIVRVYRGGAA